MREQTYTGADTLAHGYDIYLTCGRILGHVRSIDRKMGGGGSLFSRLAPPQGIEAHSQGGGWWFLDWPAVPGATGYEQDHPDTGHGPTSGTRTSIFAVATGDTRTIRIRAVAGTDRSPWVNCTVWWDGRLKIDIDGGEPPPPPAIPVITAVTAGHQNIAAWWDSPDGEQWAVRLLNDAGEVEGEYRTSEPAIVLNGLRLGTRYGVQVAALAGGQGSDWSEISWTKTLDDPTGPPSPPTGLTVHCVTAGSAKAEWDGDTEVDGWEVWLNDDVEQAVYTASRLVHLSDLTASTTYTANVVAVRGEHRSGVTREVFRTLSDEPPPPPPEPDEEDDPDYPAPSGLIVQPTGTSSLEMFWQHDGSDYAVVSLDRVHWFRLEDGATYHEWTGLPPGTARIAHLYTRRGDRISDVTFKAATTRRS